MPRVFYERNGMKFKTLIALICRSEIEKTPKIVTEHELKVLQALHTPERIEITNAASPAGDIEKEPEEEYQRLLNEYQQADGKPHPVVEVFGDYEGFLEVISGEKKSRRTKAE